MFGPEITRQEKFFRLQRPFTASDVRTRFRKASLRWHPDKNPHRRERAQDMFVNIVQAKDFLMGFVQKNGGIVRPPQEESTSNLVDAVKQFLKVREEQERAHRYSSSRRFYGEEYGTKSVVLNALLKKHLRELHDDLGLLYSKSDRKKTFVVRLKKQTWDTLNKSLYQEHTNRIRSRLEI